MFLILCFNHPIRKSLDTQNCKAILLLHLLSANNFLQNKDKNRLQQPAFRRAGVDKSLLKCL